MAHKLWSEMDPEELDAARRASRRRRKLRAMGRSSMVDPGVTAAHVRYLHDECGMSFREIANAAPLSNRGSGIMAASTPADLYRGRRPGTAKPIGEIPRTTQDRLLAVTPGISGMVALVDPTGTIRRLQALARAGFGLQYLSELLGHSNRNTVWRMTKRLRSDGERGYEKVHVKMRDAVAQMYDKLADADPVDYGFSAKTVGRAKGAAISNGYAPPSCWDDDTIDDPDAFPEWTGRCGSLTGYVIHMREKIPVCEACSAARKARRYEFQGWTFKHELLAQLMARKGFNAAQLERHIDVAAGSVSRWLKGTYGPRPGTERAYALAELLGVDWEDLYDKE